MTRDEIRTWLLGIFAQRFEIQDPGMDDDLRAVHEFDSIDAIELLAAIEIRLGIRLSQDDKKDAMMIRTINQIVAYIEAVAGRMPVEEARVLPKGSEHDAASGSSHG